jgi:hypothetical protein
VECRAGECEDLRSLVAHLFDYGESREHAGQYMHGLRAPVARKHCWRMAEMVGEDDAHAWPSIKARYLFYGVGLGEETVQSASRPFRL